MKKILLSIAIGAGIFLSATTWAQTLVNTTNANSVFTTTDGESNMPNALPVYPNPVTSSTSIALLAPSISMLTVKVIDMNGVIMRSYEYAPGTSVLDVDMSRLPTGLYSVRVFGKDIAGYNLKVVKD